MKGKTLFVLLMVLLSSIGLMFTTGCISKEESDKIGVIVTIPPQAEMVNAVGGDKVDVTVMVPEGQDPHSYAPVPSQMKAVIDAEIYFKVGSGVEFEKKHLSTIKEQNSGMTIYDCSIGIEVKSFDEHHTGEHENNETSDHTHNETTNGDDSDHDHDGDDPHIWLSVKNAMIMVQNIFDGLVAIDAENEEYYKNNRDEYLTKLNDFLTNATEELTPYKDREFLVYHPSWGYFGDDFDLIQLAIEEDGKQPGPVGLTKIIEQAKEHKIKVIFVSPQFDTSSAKTIAQEINGEVVTVNPLAKNYLENLRDVVNKMAEGFEK